MKKRWMAVLALLAGSLALNAWQMPVTMAGIDAALGQHDQEVSAAWRRADLKHLLTVANVVRRPVTRVELELALRGLPGADTLVIKWEGADRLAYEGVNLDFTGDSLDSITLNNAVN